jgi:hypothetical protein
MPSLSAYKDVIVDLSRKRLGPIIVDGAAPQICSFRFHGQSLLSLCSFEGGVVLKSCYVLEVNFAFTK